MAVNDCTKIFTDYAIYSGYCGIWGEIFAAWFVTSDKTSSDPSRIALDVNHAQSGSLCFQTDLQIPVYGNYIHFPVHLKHADKIHWNFLKPQWAPLPFQRSFCFRNSGSAYIQQRTDGRSEMQLMKLLRSGWYFWTSLSFCKCYYCREFTENFLVFFANLRKLKKSITGSKPYTNTQNAVEIRKEFKFGLWGKERSF